MTVKVGARNHPFTQGKGRNFLAEAEAIVGRGKPLEQFTREEHREALAMAIAELQRLGLWPENHTLKRNPPVMCPQGHQHASCRVCPDCERIHVQRLARERKRRQIERKRVAA
jgi:hypothetical protein